MSRSEIEKIEQRPAFKLFIRRIGCKNFDEYMQLFKDNWDKRETACKWFFETYQFQAKD